MGQSSISSVRPSLSKGSPIVFALLAVIQLGCQHLGSGVQAPLCANLDDKLTHQWLKYEQASAYVADHYAQETPELIERADWEDRLIAHPGCQLSDKELQQLRDRQEARVAESRIRAAKLSRFDLDRVRQQSKLVQRLCREIPKGGLLHIHPSGTVTVDLLREVLQKHNPIVDGQDLIQRVGGLTLYPEERAFLQKWPKGRRFKSAPRADQEKLLNLFVLSEKPASHPFTRFDVVFVLLDWLEEVVGKQKFDLMVYEDFLARAKKAGVSYVEFTRSTGSRPNFAQVYPPLHQAFMQKFGIDVRWNGAFARTRSAEKTASD